mmetsp:Transcript_15724/g.37570  ORF Transcript_15724/g.37570 Transcript_15724/m.37570 type:complete len:259 (-) Transcript_15724:525-1301(-)
MTSGATSGSQTRMGRTLAGACTGRTRGGRRLSCAARRRAATWRRSGTRTRMRASARCSTRRVTSQRGSACGIPTTRKRRDSTLRTSSGQTSRPRPIGTGAWTSRYLPSASNWEELNTTTTASTTRRGTTTRSRGCGAWRRTTCTWRRVARGPRTTSSGRAVRASLRWRTCVSSSRPLSASHTCSRAPTTRPRSPTPRCAGRRIRMNSSRCGLTHRQCATRRAGIWSRSTTWRIISSCGASCSTRTSTWSCRGWGSRTR